MFTRVIQPPPRLPSGDKPILHPAVKGSTGVALPRQGGGKYRGLRFRFFEVDGAPRPPARPPGAVVLGRHSFLLNAPAPISVMDVSVPREIAQSQLTPGETALFPQPLNPGEPGGLGLRPGAPRGRPRQGLIHLR